MTDLQSVAKAGAAFADHLRNRNPAAAATLSTTLDVIGEGRRAELLTAFAAQGPHIAAADWWAPGTICHVSLDLPDGQGPDEVWFDPLEVSFAVARPWKVIPERLVGSSTIHSWIALGVVAPWQLIGAHLLDPEVPGAVEGSTPNDASNYCGLFSKSLADSGDWQSIRSSYDLEVLRQLWGPDEEQLGGGGVESGSIEILSLAEIEEWQPDTRPYVRETKDFFDTSLPFRTHASVQQGLWVGEGALPRTWNA